MSGTGNGDNRSLYGGLAACCRAWRVDSRTDGCLQAAADFAFPGDYAGFSGHFPERPILPAIVQLAAVRYLAECVLGVSLLPRRYEKTKFREIVGPGERVAVKLSLVQSPDGWRGSFTLTRPDGKKAATGSVEYLVETSSEGT